MRELEQCLELRRKINGINERIEELRSSIETPKCQTLSDMPKGGGERNTIEEYIIKLERLEQKKAVIEQHLVSDWRTISADLKKNGVFDDVILMLKYRFFYGYRWKKCAVHMQWNENKCFREYRAFLSKMHKKDN